jgi:hypothetical protein
VTEEEQTAYLFVKTLTPAQISVMDRATKGSLVAEALKTAVAKIEKLEEIVESLRLDGSFPR